MPKAVKGIAAELEAHAGENGVSDKWEEKKKEWERPTEPEDPEEADEAEFSGSERGHGAFAEEFDNDTVKERDEYWCAGGDRWLGHTRG